MVRVHYLLTEQNPFGSSTKKANLVGYDSEDSYFDAAGVFILNDLMRRARRY